MSESAGKESTFSLLAEEILQDCFIKSLGNGGQVSCCLFCGDDSGKEERGHALYATERAFSDARTIYIQLEFWGPKCASLGAGPECDSGGQPGWQGMERPQGTKKQLQK